MQNKDDIGYAISDYYSAQCSPGDCFDVNMKAYSFPFFSSNKELVQLNPKITPAANRTL